ncbi:MAG: tRNA-dihydrouridine synthase, partial [Psychrobacter sp.]
RYDDVYRLKQDFPTLDIEINGGIETVEDIKTHLQHVDGVMIGRAFYHNPYLLAEANSLWDMPAPKRSDVLAQLYPYLEEQIAKGEALPTMTRHYLGLFQGLMGARKWRQALSGKPQLTLDDVKRAADEVLTLNPDI